MTPPLLQSTDIHNKFEDLSGVDSASYANPYDALIEASDDDPAKLQARYSTHRSTRNAQQREKLLSPDFSGLILDPILQRLVDLTIEPGFKDWRNCLVFWARPPSHIRSLVDEIQQKLRSSAPMTALEITFSLTAPEISSIIQHLGPSPIQVMTDYTSSHRARLIRPMLSYDGAAIALSFLPAAGEGLNFPSRTAQDDATPVASDNLPASTRSISEDSFTYHHLRRDLFSISASTGVKVDSRYVVPSSHITIGRFLTQDDHDTKEKMAAWIARIDEINDWLEKEFWEEGKIEGEWIVGQERGLDCRRGTLWYGGGETVRLGKGF